MQRANSPAPGEQSQDTTNNVKPAGQRAAYRLFPSVASTPPASISTFQKASLQKAAAAELRRRSNSLDGAKERWALLSRNGRPSQTSASQGGKASVSEMNSIQEQSTLKSPTFASRRTYPPAETPKADESGHGRSSSASEKTKELPSARQTMTPTWHSRVAASSAQTLHGLGLTLPHTAPQDESQATKKRLKPKTNLRLDIRKSNKDDQPPPPPPKSPRHGRSSSRASQASSVDSTASLKTTHTCAPISTAQSMAYQPVRPVFVQSTTSSSRSSPTVPAMPKLPFRSAEQSIQDALNSPDTEDGPPMKKIILRKAVPPGPPPAQSSFLQELGKHAPSSKFSSLASPSIADSAEGERTPKATQQSQVPSPQTTQVQPSDIKERRPTVKSGTIMDAFPPTPRKDSFMQRKSDEPAENHRSNQGQNFGPPPPTPSKDVCFMPRSPRAHGAGQLSSPIIDTFKRPKSPNPQPISVALQAPSRKAPKARNTSEPPLRTVVLDKGPTPDLPTRATTPVSPRGRPDPSLELSNLTKQTEALHKRYATLRSDRQMLQTSIVASLKEQKAGPEYANTLLDQHLQLTAINSSMDICFAKLKSLECKKEEAMAAIIAQHKTQYRADTTFRERESDNARSVGSPRSDRSGRRTPDMKLDVRAGTQQRSSSKLRTPSPLPKSDRADREPLPALDVRDPEKKKRNTMIRTSDSPENAVVDGRITAEPEELSQAIEDAEDEPKRIHIKGAKAAKLLGLMNEAAVVGSGHMGITLPDGVGTTNQQPMIEVHIPSSPFKVRSPLLPSLDKTLPTPPPSATHDAKSGYHHSSTRSDASSASTVSSSIVDDAELSTAPTSRTTSSKDTSSPSRYDEANTPKSEQREIDDELASKSHAKKAGMPTRGKSVQTIQVYVDDEILDYEQDKILDYYGMGANASPERTRKRHR